EKELTVGDIVFPRNVTESSHPIAPEEYGLLRGYDQEKPLFLGHYWLSGEPEPLTPRIACLDFSVAAGGKLVAYTFRGEKELVEEHFVSVARRS
ncbi:MAG: metallophosphoesterase, partial [Alkalispirochaetaceae bacterium]